jgi:hypothetical protein
VAVRLVLEWGCHFQQQCGVVVELASGMGEDLAEQLVRGCLEVRLAQRADAVL